MKTYEVELVRTSYLTYIVTAEDSDNAEQKAIELAFEEGHTENLCQLDLKYCEEIEHEKV